MICIKILGRHPIAKTEALAGQIMVPERPQVDFLFPTMAEAAEKPEKP